MEGPPKAGPMVRASDGRLSGETFDCASVLLVKARMDVALLSQHKEVPSVGSSAIAGQADVPPSEGSICLGADRKQRTERIAKHRACSMVHPLRRRDAPALPGELIWHMVVSAVPDHVFESPTRGIG